MDLIKVENGAALLDTATLNSIIQFETALKELKAKEDELKANILAEMEAKNIIKIDTEKLLINYIAPTDRETFDSKAFKADHQDIYDEYIKLTPVKASIRIKVKEG